MADTLRVSNLSSTSGSVALTINNDQSLIGYGDHWNVGNVNGSGQSGNWSTFGANWYACSGFGTTLVSTVNYKQCCISWNGQYVLFTATNPSYGPYFSNNGGYTVATVSPDVSAAGNFYGCAMSASGQYTLVANLTTVFLSSNFLTMPLSAVYSSTAYTSVLSVTSTTNSLAMSASGQYAVFAYSASASTGGIYLSSNYGVTWSLVSGTNFPWQSVSMSSSGQYITACCNGTPNNIYISSNGATFSLPSTTVSSVAGWRSVKVSSSGQYQVAAATNYVYYSSDYGMTWTASSMSSSITWGCVAVSPSGKYMIASNNAATSYMYTNSNYGAGAWTQQANGSNQYSICLAVSSTGTVAYASNGNTIIMSALTTAAAPLLAPALAMGTNPNATSNALWSVYTSKTSGVGTGGGGAIALGMNYGSPAVGVFGGVGDKLILYHGTASSYPYSIGVDTSKFYCSAPTGVSYGWIIGGTTRMTLDSSGYVGIGTAPTNTLHVYNASSGYGITIDSPAASTCQFQANSAGTQSWAIYRQANTTNFGIYMTTLAATALTILGSNGYVGIGTATPSDSLVVNSGSIVINNSAAANAGYLFNQNSVWGGVDIEGIANTGAQTINVGVNMNRAKAWSSSYSGLWFRIDTRTGYNGFHFFNKAVTSGTESEIMTILSSGNVGIGTATPGYALHVVGAIFATGNVTAYSDQRYKQNITRLDGSLDAIRSLSGYSYTRLDYLPGVRQIGLLAQEVKTVLPEAVSYDSTNDIYSVNYNCLMAPVVEAIKELYDRSETQASIIQAQQLTIQKLMERLESL